MTAKDWQRLLLATEVVFASDLIGSGHDWPITTGFADERTIHLLRSIQRKTTGRLRSIPATTTE